MNRLRLTVSYRDRVRRFPLPEGERRLGSSPDCDLVAPFPGVSREHAIVHPHEAGIRIVDAGSKNGLIAFGERLEELVLEPGQEVLLGHAALVLETAESEDVDVALELVSEDSTESTELYRRAHSDQETPAPQNALRLIREWELGGTQDRDPSVLLQKARAALGAHSILELAGDEQSAEIRSCLGEVVSEAAMELIELHLAHARANEVKAVLLESDPPTSALLAVASDEVRVVTTLPGRPSTIDPWQSELLLYVALRLHEARGPLGDSTSAKARRRNRAAGEDFELPELKPPPEMVLGTSEAMCGLMRHLRVAAGSNLNVLLLGETGTGKELIARTIHASGTHAGGPFVAINCAAIPAELLEAELFGIAGRVATGVDARPGLFLQAQGGAIFLDEVSETSDRVQAKLLRVLQEREVLPVGGTEAKKIDVQIIASSNRDLENDVLEGRFRDDLFFRLRGLQFHVPPLRDRREDIPQFVLHFARRAARKYGRRIQGVSRRALDLLTRYPWPGNVRELEHEVERAVLLCEGSRVLRSDHFSPISRRWKSSEPRWESDSADGPRLDADEDGNEIPANVDEPSDAALQPQLDSVERQAILRALARTGGNKTRAARALGITRNGLALKMKRLGIEPEAGQQDPEEIRESS